MLVWPKPNQSNRRSALQWYFPLQSKWVFSGCADSAAVVEGCIVEKFLFFCNMQPSIAHRAMDYAHQANGPQQIHLGSAKFDQINESFHPRRAIYNMLGWFYVLLFKCKKSYHFLLYLSMDRPFLMLKSVNWTPWSSLLPNVLLSSFTIAINVHWSHSGYLKMASHEFNKIRRLIDFS